MKRNRTLLSRFPFLLSTHVEEVLRCSVVLTYVRQMLSCLLIKRLLGVIAASRHHSLRLLKVDIKLALRTGHSMIVRLLDRACGWLLLGNAGFCTLLVSAHFVDWPSAAIAGVVLLT